MPSIYHDRREWFDDGIYYTTHTASYSSPGFSFHAMGGSANMFNAFAGTHDHRRSRPEAGSTSILGTAAGLIDNLLSSRQPKKPKAPKYSRRSSRRVPIDDDDTPEESNESDEHADPDPAAKRRSVLGRFKDKIQPSSRNSGSTSRSRSRDREVTPPPPFSRGRDRQPRPDRGVSNRSSRPYSTYDIPEVNNEYENYPLPSPPIGDKDMERMLESAVEHHRREVLKCKKLLEHATRQPHTTFEDLQDLLDDMRDHDEALQNANQTLERARNNRSAKWPLDTSDYPPQHPPQPILEHPQGSFEDFDYPSNLPHPRDAQLSHIFEDFQGMQGMDPFAQSIYTQQYGMPTGLERSMPPDDYLEDYFGLAGAQMYDRGNRKSAPNSSSQRYYSYSASRPRPMSTFVPSTAPVKPPPSMLTPMEAQRLFQQYNNHWNSLTADDPHIAYPTRGLHGAALTGRDTLWAPNLEVRPAHWSEEAVMQANAQAFYLGVVGLSPKYGTAPGRGVIEMGFDKNRASPQQVKALIDLLKKEKMRWHSDRLGRRNNGRSGMNETLQQDPKARAVFHAACELMSAAQ